MTVHEAEYSDLVKAGVDVGELPFFGIVGKHVGIVIAYAVVYWEDDKAWLVSYVPPFVKSQRWSLAKFAHKFVTDILKAIPEITVARDPEEPNSDRFLTFLGFENTNKVVHNHEIWVRHEL